MNTETMPWWQRLPSDFHLSPNHTGVERRHPLKVRGTAALDMVARTALGSLMSLTAVSKLASLQMHREVELLEFYAGLAESKSAEEIFLAPPRDVTVRVKAIPRLAYRPRGIPARLLTFTSPYVALNPTLREEYADHHRNARVVAQHWTHPDGPRPTLIFTHGYVMDSYALNSAMFSLQWFYKKGYDVLLFTLPFHGYRKGWLHPYGGFNYCAGSFAGINEAMLQAVFDLRILMNYLEDEGVPCVGVSGLSMGGYVSSLLACADSRPAFVIPNAPIVSMADTIMELAPFSWVLGFFMSRLGIGLQDVRRYLAVHSALSYAPKVDSKRLFLIGGAGDRITSPRYLKLLHEHWAGSRIHWFPGNHLVHLHQREYLRTMHAFMNECCAVSVGQ